MKTIREYGHKDTPSDSVPMPYTIHPRNSFKKKMPNALLGQVTTGAASSQQIQEKYGTRGGQSWAAQSRLRVHAIAQEGSRKSRAL